MHSCPGWWDAQLFQAVSKEQPCHRTLLDQHIWPKEVRATQRPVVQGFCCPFFSHITRGSRVWKVATHSQKFSAKSFSLRNEKVTEINRIYLQRFSTTGPPKSEDLNLLCGCSAQVELGAISSWLCRISDGVRASRVLSAAQGGLTGISVSLEKGPSEHTLSRPGIRTGAPFKNQRIACHFS